MLIKCLTEWFTPSNYTDPRTIGLCAPVPHRELFLAILCVLTLAKSTVMSELGPLTQL